MSKTLDQAATEYAALHGRGKEHYFNFIAGADWMRARFTSIGINPCSRCSAGGVTTYVTTTICPACENEEENKA